MALHVCKECGKQFLCESDKYICPDCLAAKPKTTLAPRSCKTCGNIFIGGPRAWYCPSCRAERQRERQNANRGKKTRPLGSIDLCEVCGKEYTVNGGLQRYCPDCAEKTIKENVQARKREYMAENRDRIREITRPQKTCVICGVLLPPKTTCITCGSPECIETRRKQQQRAGEFYRGKSARYPEGYVPTKKGPNSRSQPPAQPEKIYKAKSDITGQKFGYLTAVRPTDERQGTSVVWEFVCDCGNTVHFSAAYVKAQTKKGNPRSCGCMNLKGRKAQDLTGQKFGYLTAMHPTNERQGHSVVWEFACDCGNTIHFSTAYVKAQTKKGNSLSCGCMNPNGRKIRDITGQKYGCLTAIRPTAERKNTNVVWEFQCECGNTVLRTASYVKQQVKMNHIPSCGCKRKTAAKDITGQKYGYLTAIRPTAERKYTSVVWEFQCECGNIIQRAVNQLELAIKKGYAPSCGCMNQKALNMAGQKFGYLTAIRPTTERKNSNVVWEFQCECGNTVLYTASYVKQHMKMGGIPSCGCQNKTRAKDIAGQKFGSLTAIRPTAERKDAKVVWEFQCECGNIVQRVASEVRAQMKNGYAPSCGCNGEYSPQDVTGQKFGYLTAIRPTTERKNSNVVWEFQCECGTLMRRTVSQVRTQMKMGHIPSCGCKRGTSAKDLTGQKFGCLTAMCPTDERENGSVVWEFACECGNTVHFSAGYVKAQTRKGTLLSCGCMTPKGRKVLDLTGQKFGYLTAVRPTDERQGSSVVWEFACECGNTVYLRSAYVKAQTKKGKSLSCGCTTSKGRKALDITGQKFGYLTAIRPTTERKGSNMVWEFQCECGNIVRLNPACIISRIKKGQKPSCGCMTQKGRKAKDMNTIEQDK